MADSLAVAAGGRRFASGWIRISGPVVDFWAPALLEVIRFVRTPAPAYSAFIATSAEGRMAVEAVPFVRKARAFLTQSVEIVRHILTT